MNVDIPPEAFNLPFKKGSTIDVSQEGKPVNFVEWGEDETFLEFDVGLSLPQNRKTSKISVMDSQPKSAISVIERDGGIMYSPYVTGTTRFSGGTIIDNRGRPSFEDIMQQEQNNNKKHTKHMLTYFAIGFIGGPFLRHVYLWLSRIRKNIECR